MKGECNMALINCPECGKEVSDKAEVCIHCGYPLADMIKSELVEESKIHVTINKTEINEQIINLIKDSEYPLSEKDLFIKLKKLGLEISRNTLSECLADLISSNSIKTFFDGILKYEIQEQTKIEEPTPSFSIIDKYKSKTPDELNSSPVKCPKCGSTQIQMVQRKWTPIMGIFTNKVDRVCMNCKHKF